MGGPIEGVAQLAGDGGKFMVLKGATVGQDAGAVDAGPETAVGEAVVGVGRVEMLKKFALGDVGNEADVGAGGLERVAAIEQAETAGIPGTTQQRREMPFGAPQGVKDGGELFGNGEEAAVGGGLLIAQSVDQASRAQASGGDAVSDPRLIDLGEETLDLIPAGSLAGFARFADQDYEEVEAMRGGADQAVWARAGRVAEGGQELKKDGRRVSFGVRGESAEDLAGQAVQCLFAQREVPGWLLGVRRRDRGRGGLRVRIRRQNRRRDAE